jgi:hypothetical protein
MVVMPAEASLAINDVLKDVPSLSFRPIVQLNSDKAASFTGDGSLNGGHSISSAGGDKAFETASIDGGLYDSASINTTVLGGSFAAAGTASGMWNYSQVTEAVAASGDIIRTSGAEVRFVPPG